MKKRNQRKRKEKKKKIQGFKYIITLWTNNLTLGLDLEAKRIEEDAIWNLIVLEVIIARLGIIAELR